MAFNTTNQIIDTRFIGKNVLKFIKDENAAVLALANDDNPLKEFQVFSENIENRTKPVFPLLEITGEKEGVELDSDLNMTAYEITFEAIIYSANAADLPALVKKYAHALKILLSNVPPSVLLAGTEQNIRVKTHSVETEYDGIRPNEQQNGFFQLFETKAIWKLYAAAY